MGDHGNLPGEYQCRICGNYDFNSEDEVQSHIQAVHKITCPRCPTVFYRENNLQAHMNNVHYGLAQAEHIVT